MSSILIIGGNSEIGFATAKIFAKNKYDIHLASRNIDQLNIKKNDTIIMPSINFISSYNVAKLFGAKISSSKICWKS